METRDHGYPRHAPPRPDDRGGSGRRADAHGAAASVLGAFLHRHRERGLREVCLSSFFSFFFSRQHCQSVSVSPSAGALDKTVLLIPVLLHSNKSVRGFPWGEAFSTNIPLFFPTRDVCPCTRRLMLKLEARPPVCCVLCVERVKYVCIPERRPCQLFCCCCCLS